MPKRFRDTELWDEDWYLDLSGAEMLFFAYICDRCDHAGLWRPNFKRFEIMTGHRINRTQFLEKLNSDRERVRVLPNEKWFIVGFVPFQYGHTLNTKNRVHNSIVNTLEKNEVSIESTVCSVGVKQGSSKGHPRVNHTLKEKEKEKDIGGVGGKRFKPPTIEEVASYCKERNNRIKPEAFVAKYEANGWLVGKNKMKDWKAAVRYWETNSLQFTPARPPRNAPGT